MVSCYTNLSSYKTNIFYAPEHVQLPVSITQAVVQLKQFLNLNIWAFFLTSDLTWSTRKALDCVIKCHLFQANSNATLHAHIFGIRSAMQYASCVHVRPLLSSPLKLQGSFSSNVSICALKQSFDHGQ